MALTKISTGVIAANTLATANIADNSVDATKIASNSILTRHIDDDQITGDQLADNITIAGNLTITGNLVTNGSSVTNSSSNTTIEDAIIELGTGTSGAPATDAGIVIERGSSDNVFIGWDESADKVTVGTGSFTGASTGNLTITAAPFVSGALTASGISYPTSDGSAGQVLKTDGSGTLTFGDNTTKVDNYTATGNGSTTAFDTGINPGNEVNTWIFIDGVYQQKSQYSYSGSTVTFSTAPENGALIDVVTGTSSNITASDTVLGVYEATTSNTAAYSTGISAANENNTWVFVGGVYQPKDSYTFSGGTLTFDANTPTGQKLSVVATKTLTAGAVETSSLAANAITSAKIASNAILSRHIVNNSIVGADISATTQITANTFTGALTGNVTGNVAGNLTGTILTAAQTNITSVGTLSALTVSGQLTAGGIAYPTSDGSADQVLKTDGSGALSFGTVSGTTLNNNTNNYVMTGTGSSNTLNGEANLTFDGTNVVIGSSNALGLLTIKAPSSDDQDLITISEDGTNQAFSINSNFAGSGSTNNNITLDSYWTNDIISFRGDGNIGIGTASPVAPLTINDKATFSFNSSDFALGHQLYYDGGDDRWERLTGNAGSAIYQTAGNVLFYRTAAGGSTGDAVTPTESMRIDSSGRVGIGTNSPSTELHIKSTDANALTVETDTAINQIHLSNSTNSPCYLTQDSYGLQIKADENGWGGTASFFSVKVKATERMRIDANGYFLIRATSDTYDSGQLQLTSPGDLSSMYVSNTGFASHGQMVGVERGATSAYSFANYYSGRRPDNGGGDREFNFRGDGNAYADASWNASGADYAEYFEWADGNTDNNDRVGYSVSLVNNKIKIAESGETVIGVISGNPSVVGDTSWNKWQGKHMRDDYGRYIWEEYTEEGGKTVDDKGNKLTRRKLNPDKIEKSGML